MKNTIIGATDNLGSRVTRLAASAGHEVVAFASRPEAVPALAGVRTEAGSAEEVEALAAAADGADLVLVSITGKISDTTFMQDRMPGIITAAKRAGVPRLVLVSVFGAGDTRDKASGIAQLVYRTALSRFLADKAAADELLRASGLEWTILYPVNLKDAPSLGEAAALLPLDEVERVPGLPTLPMDDAAAAILRAIERHDSVNARLLITTPKGFRRTRSAQG